MALQQPQRHRARPQSFSNSATGLEAADAAPARQRSPSPEPREWILFAPDTISDSYGHPASTTHTAGRLSDFGSLGSAAVDEAAAAAAASRAPGGGADADTYADGVGDADDDEDLDSLDDGLHEFGEPVDARDVLLPPAAAADAGGRDNTVLPAHDGLGMFPGDSSPVQEQFWQHERYNPHRRRDVPAVAPGGSRRSALQMHFDALEQERPAAPAAEEEKKQRIEQWRLEQSKAILEEIEKETRRRKRKGRHGGGGAADGHDASMERTLSKSAPEKGASLSSPSSPSQRTSDLSFWERITRRVIRDLIGIDDATLEYIFGESLPEEAKSQPQPAEALHPASEASAIVDYAERAIADDALVNVSSWEDRLLARISKELGILLSHISDHPGAFSTYLRAQEAPGYAGLPTPASMRSGGPRARHPHRRQRSSEAVGSPLTADEAAFAPTLTHQQQQQQHHRRHSAMTADPSLWGIEEEEDEGGAAAPLFPTSPAVVEARESERLQREKEYWERDLDVKMVFGFLRNKLTSSTPSPGDTRSPTPEQSLPPTLHRPSASISVPTHGAASSLRRAALIRHHHPLVSRNVGNGRGAPSSSAAQVTSRPSIHGRVASSGSAGAADAAAAAAPSSAGPGNMLASGVPLSPVLGRRSSRGAEDTESCASQSTKRSRTRRSGSSRNYWDLGGRSDAASGTWSVGWGEV